MPRLAAPSRNVIDPVGICPNCGTTQDRYTGVTGRRGEPPKPGDCSICWDCRSVLVFTETGLRPPTREELAKFMADPIVRDIVVGNPL